VVVGRGAGGIELGGEGVERADHAGVRGVKRKRAARGELRRGGGKQRKKIRKPREGTDRPRGLRTGKMKKNLVQGEGEFTRRES